MTSAEFTRNRENYCYRHPDRQSFVLCQRCLRTICAECQTPAPVGVICPECMAQHGKDAAASQRAARAGSARSARTWVPRRRTATAYDTRPLATYTIIAITVVVYLTQLIPGSPVAAWLQLAGVYVMPVSGAPFQPWRMLTVLFVHESILHVGFNMLALWMIGQSLEPLLGRWRFVTLYLLSGFGASAAVVAFSSPLQPVVGASGAIFGLFGALLIIGRHIGAPIGGIAVVIGINLVFTFLPGTNIAWQAHVGGLITGAVAGLIFARTRSPRRRALQVWLLVALFAALCAVVVVTNLVLVR
ncbi:Rhomboid family protein [Microbacterium mangrovi]|uniref:Rhomboid family protein n=1 Tax=Microbacterium mangrovi TaxID=1348253 RepID=A0A0B2A345_9MICO|nr:rhomboid family intramembrane serine protease [Microbacterium mangrovi]KHK95998.1 Rhomboid family protein [Microbacterium mangrovi]